MSNYVPLFSMRVRHDFWGDSGLPGLRLEPTPRTRDIIAQAQLLLRTTGDGVEAYCDVRRSDGLALLLAEREGALDFGFKAWIHDPGFLTYSDPALSQEGAVIVVDSEQGQMDGEVLRLHREPTVSARDLLALDAAELDDLLSPRERQLPPAFLVRLRYPHRSSDSLEQLLAAGPLKGIVHFAARETYWIYYLLGEFAQRSLNIIDLDASVGFEPAAAVRLADGRPAVALRTSVAIPLQHRSKHRFQLRDAKAGKGGGKILIRRLPVAVASQFNRQRIGAQVAQVSEIYVNG